MPEHKKAGTTSLNTRARFNSVSFKERSAFGTKTEIKAPVIFGRDTNHAAARTPWPRFDKIRFDALGETRFTADLDSPDFADGTDVNIYMAGNPQLMENCRAWKLPSFKCGVSAVPDLLIRQRDLQTDAYGSCHYVNGELVREDGWTAWEMRQLELTHEPHPQSPVRAAPRSLRVRLPVGYTSQAFDKDLHRRLYSCALHTFAHSERGQAHFGLLGVDPRSVPRYILYGFGDGVRLSLANEIYICRPREDWSRLRIIAEDLIAQFLKKKDIQ